jgi:hypothetical protein
MFPSIGVVGGMQHAGLWGSPEVGPHPKRPVPQVRSLLFQQMPRLRSPRFRGGVDLPGVAGGRAVGRVTVVLPPDRPCIVRVRVLGCGCGRPRRILPQGDNPLRGASCSASFLTSRDLGRFRRQSNSSTAFQQVVELACVPPLVLNIQRKHTVAYGRQSYSVNNRDRVSAGLSA